MYASLDLETLSTQSDAAVISVGLVMFNDNNVTATRGWVLNDRAQHGHIDPRTVAWWATQSAQAREYSFSSININTAAFLDQFVKMVKEHNPTEWWSKDPHFDHVIFENWWRRAALQSDYAFPIHYRAPRSYRTLEALALELGCAREEWGGSPMVAHNPVEDATAQAQAVICMRQAIRKRLA